MWDASPIMGLLSELDPIAEDDMALPVAAKAVMGRAAANKAARMVRFDKHAITDFDIKSLLLLSPNDGHPKHHGTTRFAKEGGHRVWCEKITRPYSWAVSSKRRSLKPIRNVWCRGRWPQSLLRATHRPHRRHDIRIRCLLLDVGVGFYGHQSPPGLLDIMRWRAACPIYP